MHVARLTEGNTEKVPGFFDEHCCSYLPVNDQLVINCPPCLMLVIV